MHSRYNRSADAELVVLAHEEPGAFGELYRRHETLVLGYLARRTRDPEMAADLGAEAAA
jgi:DNA-directed RNA polymerase specialized sigma24 family protein